MGVFSRMASSCCCLALAGAAKVFVMLPLDAVTNTGSLKDEGALGSQLDKLKSANVDGFMVDVWWGITETAPKKYNFAAYQKMVSMAQSRGMHVQFVTSFHQCGGNVGDACNIPLPSFVTGASNIWYKDQQGGEDKEYISLFADNVTVQDRTPIQMYRDWFDAMATTFSADLGKTINELQISMGPAGELRYPGYQLSRWHFCGVGAFQAWDQNALASLKSHAQQAGKTWFAPPSDAGNYNSQPQDAPFFQAGYSSDYGRFFLDWYFESLKNHGAAVLSQANEAFKAFRGGLGLTGKVSGIHWWYKSPHHAAELTAGYYNTNGRDAYGEIAEMFKANGNVGVDFTCLEMRDSEQSAACGSGPEELVGQVISAAKGHGVSFSGENALPRYDGSAYDKIESYRSSLEGFTYLRLSGDLLQDNNLNGFRDFVNKMHQSADDSVLVV